MSRTLVQFPDSHAIGDTLYFLSIDAMAEANGEPIHWLLYLPNRPVYTPDAGGQWINWELWRILNRSGFFRRLLAVSNVDWEDRHSARNVELYRKLIYLTYGEHYDQIETIRPPDMQPVLMVDTMLAAFEWLGQGREPFVTIQYSSAHCNYDFHDPASARVGAKRIHPDTLVELCRSLPLNLVRFVGSLSDWPLAEDAISVLAGQCPSLTCENHCGRGLENFFRLLYNSDFHICTESNSVFFTAQLGIETVIVFFNRTTPYNIPTSNLEPFVKNKVTVMMDPRPIFGGI